MDRLDMAIAMIHEAKVERAKLEAMRRDAQRMPSTGGYQPRVRIDRSYTAPSEKAVNDYLIAAMRLLDRELY